MIPAILRKDWELHWLAAIAFPALYLAMNLAVMNDSNPQVAEAMSIPIYIVGFYLLTSLVQGDPIPSDRADWLIRPIPRRTLLFAKLTFVTIFILAPMAAIDLVLPLTAGFGLDRATIAAAGHFVSTLAGLILPVMAIAAATSSLAQCAVGAAVAAFGYSLLLPFLPWSAERPATDLVWMEDSAALTIGLVLSVAVLCLQFFGRRTRWSYAVCLVGILAFAGLARVSFEKFWGLQATLRPATAIEQAMVLKMIPQKSFLNSSSPLLPNIQIEVVGRNSSVPLFLERASMRVRFANGEIREAQSHTLQGRNFENGLFYLNFDFGLDSDLFELRRQAADAEISLYFLAFEPYQTYEFQEGNKHVPGIGRCGARQELNSLIGECLKVGDDSPATLFSSSPGEYRWAERSMDRLSPLFVRFRPTVFSWDTHLTDYEKVAVDLAGKENGTERFLSYKGPARMKATTLQGVLVRKIQIPAAKFAEWPFRVGS